MIPKSTQKHREREREFMMMGCEGESSPEKRPKLDSLATPPPYPPLRSPPRLPRLLPLKKNEVRCHRRRVKKKSALPEKYELLDKLFDSMDFAIVLLRSTNIDTIFTNIKPMVERYRNRPFTHTHLAQLKYIMPDGIQIDKIDLPCDDHTTCMKPDLRVTFNRSILPNDYKLDPKGSGSRMARVFRAHLVSFCKSNPQDADVPAPVVLIDQDSHPDATSLQLSFTGLLTHLIDTIKALEDLGLDVSKQTLTTEGSAIKTELLVTQLSTGRKVEDPVLLEKIRLTIIYCLLKHHPESTSRLATGKAIGVQAPVKKLDVDIATHINIMDDGPSRSLLCIETEDRPGLLLKVAKIIDSVNVTVESAEIDTKGLVAIDKFHVSYCGKALNESLSQVLTNRLCYYLRKLDVGGSCGY